MCHAVLKGILLVLIPNLHVSNLHIAKEIIIEKSFVVSLEDFLEGCCHLLARDIYRVILILLLHVVVQRVLAGVLSVSKKAVNNSTS